QDAATVVEVTPFIWPDGASPKPVPAEGDCYGDVALSGYEPQLLDAGDLSLAIDGGDPVALPPFPPGQFRSFLDLSSLVAPNASHTFEAAWSGGSDLPAGMLSFSTAPIIVLDPLPPLVAGVPWTMSWDVPSRVGMVFQDYPVFILCRSAELATSLTIPGDLTSVLADTFSSPIATQIAINGPEVDAALATDGSLGAFGFATRDLEVTIP
ncbi:MAG: hypothetical protein R3B72_45050, partial [Polyangiaceae bacterium]